MSNIVVPILCCVFLLGGAAFMRLNHGDLEKDLKTKQEITINNVKYKCEVSDE